MAARHLQKLRGEEVPLSGAQDADASDSEDESAAAQNPFDLLEQDEVTNWQSAWHLQRQIASTQ